jgi:hypothetical protein
LWFIEFGSLPQALGHWKLRLRLNDRDRSCKTLQGDAQDMAIAASFSLPRLARALPLCGIVLFFQSRTTPGPEQPVCGVTPSNTELFRRLRSCIISRAGVGKFLAIGLRLEWHLA